MIGLALSRLALWERRRRQRQPVARLSLAVWRTDNQPAAIVRAPWVEL